MKDANTGDVHGNRLSQASSHWRTFFRDLVERQILMTSVKLLPLFFVLPLSVLPLSVLGSKLIFQQ